MGEGIGSSAKRKKKTLRNSAPQTNTDNLDGANSGKKMKKVAKTKKRKGTEQPEAETTESFVSTSLDDFNEGKNSAEMSEKKRNKLKKKKRDKENKKKDDVHEYVPQSNEVGDGFNQQIDSLDGANSDKKMKKVSRNKKRKGTKLPETEAETTGIVVSTTPDDVIEDKNSAGKNDMKKKKLKKKKKDKENRKKVGTREYVPHSNEVDDNSNIQSGKSKNVAKIENDDATLLDDEDEVYQISSGDEDETTGMKRWIAKYHRARPGPEVLLENINEFLVDYWAQKEEERKEREDEAAEGGWTVVTHIKGRKKTTDAESGTTVGSVAQAAIVDKLSKKKDKQVGINFYRFQKREAQRNEIMMLQSKFEEDKKRIQQMRAARKFRPY